VDLIAAEGHAADQNKVADLIGLDQGSGSMEGTAARSNMVRIVNALHEPSSQMLDKLKRALSDGKLCVVDISQMRGKAGLDLAGVVLSEIFEHNQDEFTKAESRTIPTIAVIEEAQSVLGSGSSAHGDGPFVSWVKEGRKYDLGAVLITQQPGSITGDLLSQGDNWFVFHLLSQSDLTVLKRANAHFSDDLLLSLLNEPLVGHGLFWSSARERPYPLSIRVLDFAAGVTLLDPDGHCGSLDNYAQTLVGEFSRAREVAAAKASAVLGPTDAPVVEPEEEGLEDVEARCRTAAIEEIRRSDEFHTSVRSQSGIQWWRIQQIMAEFCPSPENGFQWAYPLVQVAMDEVLGKDQWTTERRDDRGKIRPFVFALPGAKPRPAQ
jgi:hypothetical protein